MSENEIGIPLEVPVPPALLRKITDLFTSSDKSGGMVSSSIGVSQNGDCLVATDGYSAIVVGDPPDGPCHATVRQEVFVEAERAKQYGRVVNLTSIERRVDKDAQIVEMPRVQDTVADSLGRMNELAELDPHMLLRIAQAASAANAMRVRILVPRNSDSQMLGFHFNYQPEGEVDLFHQDVVSVPVAGLIKAEVKRKASQDDEDEDKPVEKPKDKKPSPAKKAKAAPESAPMPTPDLEAISANPARVTGSRPDYSVDINASVERFGMRCPPLSILAEPEPEAHEFLDQGQALVSALREMKLVTELVEVHVGASVIMYELRIMRGTKPSAIVSNSDTIAMRLAATAVRVVAPLPGRDSVGVEVPRLNPRRLCLRDMLCEQWWESEKSLPVPIGITVDNEVIVQDIAETPHLLIAGATGSGKSIGVAAMLVALLLRSTPYDLRLILIDPKQVEFSFFEGLPHLMWPVISNVREEVPGVLNALVREMEARYETLKREGVRNIVEYNKRHTTPETIMPRIVVAVDELADLFGQVPEVEDMLIALAQKARAVGIHLILATQRPSVDVITGVLKANVPSRIAFQVASGTDSKVILDSVGAEGLTGKGDMLLQSIDRQKPVRLQGPFVSGEEIIGVVRAWKDAAKHADLRGLRTQQHARNGNMNPDPGIDADTEEMLGQFK